MSITDKAKELVGITPTYTKEQRESIRREARSKATSTWFTTILDHHVAIERAFDAVKTATNARMRAKAQMQLASLLTGHSNAEEAIIYPFMKLETSASSAKHAYNEQALAKMQMVALDEITDKMSKEYDTKLEEIRTAVLHHMVEEERDFFPELQNKASAVQNRKITQHYQMEFERYMAKEEALAA
jgi:hemerythrin superfamily protein